MTAAQAYWLLVVGPSHPAHLVRDHAIGDEGELAALLADLEADALRDLRASVAAEIMAVRA